MANLNLNLGTAFSDTNVANVSSYSGNNVPNSSRNSSDSKNDFSKVLKEVKQDNTDSAAKNNEPATTNTVQETDEQEQKLTQNTNANNANATNATNATEQTNAQTENVAAQVVATQNAATKPATEENAKTDTDKKEDIAAQEMAMVGMMPILAMIVPVAEPTPEAGLAAATVGTGQTAKIAVNAKNAEAAEQAVVNQATAQATAMVGQTLGAVTMAQNKDDVAVLPVAGSSEQSQVEQQLQDKQTVKVPFALTVEQILEPPAVNVKTQVLPVTAGNTAQSTAPISQQASTNASASSVQPLPPSQAAVAAYGLKIDTNKNAAQIPVTANTMADTSEELLAGTGVDNLAATKTNVLQLAPTEKNVVSQVKANAENLKAAQTTDVSAVSSGLSAVVSDIATKAQAKNVTADKVAAVNLSNNSGQGLAAVAQAVGDQESQAAGMRQQNHSQTGSQFTGGPQSGEEMLAIADSNSEKSNEDALTLSLGVLNSVVADSGKLTEQTVADTMVSLAADISALQQNSLTATNVSASLQPQQPQFAADPEQVLNQIVDHARLINTADKSEMVINLKPEHLGELTVKINVSGGVVNASFHSNNADVRGILETALPQLKQDLLSQGIKVDNVGIYTGLDQHASEQQGQWEQAQQQSASGKAQKVAQDNKYETDAEITGVNAINTTAVSGLTTGIDYRA